MKYKRYYRKMAKQGTLLGSLLTRVQCNYKPFITDLNHGENSYIHASNFLHIADLVNGGTILPYKQQPTRCYFFLFPILEAVICSFHKSHIRNLFIVVTISFSLLLLYMLHLVSMNYEKLFLNIGFGHCFLASISMFFSASEATMTHIVVHNEGITNKCE